MAVLWTAIGAAVLFSADSLAHPMSFVVDDPSHQGCFEQPSVQPTSRSSHVSTSNKCTIIGQDGDVLHSGVFTPGQLYTFDVYTQYSNVYTAIGSQVLHDSEHTHTSGTWTPPFQPSGGFCKKSGMAASGLWFTPGNVTQIFWTAPPKGTGSVIIGVTCGHEGDMHTTTHTLMESRGAEVLESVDRRQYGYDDDYFSSCVAEVFCATTWTACRADTACALVNATYPDVYTIPPTAVCSNSNYTAYYSCLSSGGTDTDCGDPFLFPPNCGGTTTASPPVSSPTIAPNPTTAAPTLTAAPTIYGETTEAPVVATTQSPVTQAPVTATTAAPVSLAACINETGYRNTYGDACTVYGTTDFAFCSVDVDAVNSSVTAYDSCAECCRCSGSGSTTQCNGTSATTAAPTSPPPPTAPPTLPFCIQAQIFNGLTGGCEVYLGEFGLFSCSIDTDTVTFVSALLVCPECGSCTRLPACQNDGVFQSSSGATCNSYNANNPASNCGDVDVFSGLTANQTCQECARCVGGCNVPNTSATTTAPPVAGSGSGSGRGSGSGSSTPTAPPPPTVPPPTVRTCSPTGPSLAPTTATPTMEPTSAAPTTAAPTMRPTYADGAPTPAPTQMCNGYRSSFSAGFGGCTVYSRPSHFRFCATDVDIRNPTRTAAATCYECGMCGAMSDAPTSPTAAPSTLAPTATPTPQNTTTVAPVSSMPTTSAPTLLVSTTSLSPTTRQPTLRPTAPPAPAPTLYPTVATLPPSVRPTPPPTTRAPTVPPTRFPTQRPPRLNTFAPTREAVINTQSADESDGISTTLIVVIIVGAILLIAVGMGIRNKMQREDAEVAAAMKASGHPPQPPLSTPTLGGAPILAGGQHPQQPVYYGAGSMIQNPAFTHPALAHHQQVSPYGGPGGSVPYGQSSAYSNPPGSYPYVHPNAYNSGGHPYGQQQPAYYT